MYFLTYKPVRANDVIGLESAALDWTGTVAFDIDAIQSFVAVFVVRELVALEEHPLKLKQNNFILN